MDPLRVFVRCAFALLVLLALVRLSGKRTLRHGDAFEFTIALVLGDIVDDAIWAEVPLSKFVVAAVALVGLHLAFEYVRFRGGMRAAAD
jgi:uncharacterized membrane protein YcaP (DUF421 family)